MVRGNFSTFDNVVVSAPCFDKCTACSAAVVGAYADRGMSMLMEAFNDPKSLERITQLDELHRAVDLDELDVEWDDDDEDALL